MSGVIRGLFFDMDGTLADTHVAGSLAYQRALADEGHNVALERVSAAVRAGRGSSEFLRELAPSADADQVGRIQAKKHDHYAKLMDRVTFNARLIAFLASMKSNHKILLVTHAKKKNVDLVLAAAGLTDAFDHIVTYEDAGAHKPNPAGYLRALELAQLDPHEVIAFEDSPAGAEAARAAGIAVIMVEMSHEG